MSLLESSHQPVIMPEQVATVVSEPKALRIVDSPQMDRLLVSIIGASHDPVESPGIHRDFVAEHLPAGLNLAETNRLSHKLFAVSYNAVPRRAKRGFPDYDTALLDDPSLELPGKDRKQYDMLSLVQAGHARRHALTWLGELSCFTGDVTTAQSITKELRLVGGLSNRRAARYVARTIRHAKGLPFSSYSGR